MARRPPEPPRRSRTLRVEEMQLGIKKLDRRIRELQALNPADANWSASSSGVLAKIGETVSELFDPGTVEHDRWSVFSLSGNQPLTLGMGLATDPVPYRKEGIAGAISTLQTCRQMFEEKLEDYGYAPTADSFVRLNHNSGDYTQATTRLAELESALSNSNSYDDSDDRQQRVAEVAAGRRLLQAPRIRIEAAKELLLKCLRYLVEKFADHAIGLIAGAAITFLLALLGI